VVDKVLILVAGLVLVEMGLREQEVVPVSSYGKIGGTGGVEEMGKDVAPALGELTIRLSVRGGDVRERHKRLEDGSRRLFVLARQRTYIPCLESRRDG
jgi:hypothetical protein